MLSVAVRDTGDMDDIQMSNVFLSFATQHREELFSRRVRRITFAALKKYYIHFFLLIFKQITN